MAGAQSSGGDSSGVSQSLHGTLLSFMPDSRTTGMLFVGPHGTSKSAIAKAAGNEGRIPTLLFDLSAVKTSLVGEWERQLRQALKIISTISDNATLFIGTCNNIQALSPELRRRFGLGTFFFPLPTRDGFQREYDRT
ncbi:AAA family ATPase [Nitrospira sp. Nam74]